MWQGKEEGKGKVKGQWKEQACQVGGYLHDSSTRLYIVGSDAESLCIWHACPRFRSTPNAQSALPALTLPQVGLWSDAPPLIRAPALHPAACWLHPPLPALIFVVAGLAAVTTSANIGSRFITAAGSGPSFAMMGERPACACLVVAAALHSPCTLYLRCSVGVFLCHDG